MTNSEIKILFDVHAKTYGVDQAVWVAKYFGITLNVLKEWMREYLN